MSFPRHTITQSAVPAALSLLFCTLPTGCRSAPETKDEAPPATSTTNEATTKPTTGKPLLPLGELVRLAKEHAATLTCDEQAGTFQNLGVGFAERGNYPEAEELFRLALNAARSITEDREGHLTNHLINLNGTLLHQAKFSEIVTVSAEMYAQSSLNGMLRFVSLVGIARGLEAGGKLAEASVLNYVAMMGVGDAGLAEKSHGARTVQAEYSRVGRLLRETKTEPTPWPKLRPTLESLEDVAPGITADILSRLIIESGRRPEAVKSPIGLIKHELKRIRELPADQRGDAFHDLTTAVTLAYGALGSPDTDLRKHVQALSGIGTELLTAAEQIGEQRHLHVALYRLALANRNRLEAVKHLEWIADSDAVQGFSVEGYREMIEKLRASPPPSEGSAVTSEESRR